jgi:glycerol uptake facilitator-like aquaporin
MLPRRLLAEFIGTAFLLAAIVGSGIMAERLSSDPGLRLLQNALATAGALTAVILALGPVSGAHLNPAVTIADRVFGGLTTRAATGYIAAQLAGGVAGVIVADLMFDLPAVTWSETARSGSDLWLAETVATLGLLLVIFGLVRSGRASVAAFAVGGYIAGAYYFTSSTSFANPAVTIARAFSDTFTGIAPGSVPGFLLAELLGTGVAVGLIAYLFPGIGAIAESVVVPHGPPNEALAPSGRPPATARETEARRRMRR